MIQKSALSNYVEFMQKLNFDPMKILEKFNLNNNLINYYDIHDVVEILEESAIISKRATFGLEFTQHQTHEMLGIYLALLKETNDLIQTLEYAVKYLSLHSPNMKIYFGAKDENIANGRFTLYFFLNLDRLMLQRQMIDACLARVFLICIDELQIPLNYIQSISLPHSLINSKTPYLKFFKVPVYFERPYAAIHFDEKVLTHLFHNKKILDKDLISEKILNILSLNELYKIEDKVKYLIRAYVGLNLSKEEIAHALGMHPRTLQRRLKQFNTSFDEIRDSVYRQLTYTYLKETQLYISEISYLLGYAEPSILTRACKRWFGTTPKKVRNNL